jgi:hypothetical protein
VEKCASHDFNIILSSIPSVHWITHAALANQNQENMPTPEILTWAPRSCDASGGVLEDIPDGEQFLAFFLGQHPVVNPESPFNVEFPEGMSTEAMFPEESSEYTSPATGLSHTVPCYVPGTVAEDAVIDCDPFVPSIDGEICLQPCPVSAYSDGDYATMWLLASVVGMCGFGLNSFMTLTWAVGRAVGRRHFSNIRFQLKGCVLGGVMYGLVETLPVLLLKYDLPCGCASVECTGKSTLCAINRSSVYILLFIMISLASLTCDLYHTMKHTKGHQKRQSTLNILTIVIPLLLVSAGYAFDTDDKHGGNAVLNTSRHAFNCSMRFSTWHAEWGLLWLHFMWSGACVVFFSLKSWWEIRKTSMAFDARSKSMMKTKRTIDGQKRRLFQIALQTCVCLLLNVVVTAVISAALEDWNEASDTWLYCMNYDTMYTKQWDAYTFTQGQAVCRSSAVIATEPARQECASDCRFEVYEPSSDMDLAAWESGDKHLFCDFDASYVDPFGFYDGKMACDCPCDLMVDVSQPSMLTTALSYLAQSLVTTIVGLNMAFSKDNVEVWKDLLWGRKAATSVVAGDLFEPNSRAYDDEEPGSSKGEDEIRCVNPPELSGSNKAINRAGTVTKGLL